MLCYAFPNVRLRYKLLFLIFAFQNLKRLVSMWRGQLSACVSVFHNMKIFSLPTELNVIFDLTNLVLKLIKLNSIVVLLIELLQDNCQFTPCLDLLIALYYTKYWHLNILYQCHWFDGSLVSLVGINLWTSPHENINR